MPVQIDSIPPYLTQFKSWVYWQWTWLKPKKKRDGTKTEGKWTKPMYRLDGEYASSNKPEEWSYLFELSTLENYSGAGFVLRDEYGLVGVDLDHVIDEAGVIAPWAAEVIQNCNSYSEISPSGTGVKIWLLGTVPKRMRKMVVIDDDQQLELYGGNGRYFTSITSGVPTIGGGYSTPWNPTIPPLKWPRRVSIRQSAET